MKLWRIPSAYEAYVIEGGAIYVLADTAEDAVARARAHQAAYDECSRRWAENGYRTAPGIPHPNDFPGGQLTFDESRVECIEDGFWVHPDAIE